MRKILLILENAGLRSDLTFEKRDNRLLKEQVERLELEKIPEKVCECCFRKYRNRGFTKFCPDCVRTHAYKPR